MSRKQTVSLAGEKFNELDNWLGVMDMDPPKTPEEKQAMYQRLLEILDVMFKKPKSEKNPQIYFHKEFLHREMRRFIER